MTQSLKADLLVVEDNAENRLWLCEILNATFPDAVLYQAATLAQAYELVRQRPYYLILIDIHLPDGTGIDLVRHVRLGTDKPWCVMATAYDDDDNLFGALQAGAHGYLLKSDPAERITEQLLGILENSPPLSASVARRIMLHFHRSDTIEESLSPREMEVLKLLTLGRSNKSIASALDLSIHTVGDYIKNIYRKLEVSNRAEATSMAIRKGLVDSS